MTIATSKPMTMEEYLNYDDGTDTRYELIDGQLVEMGAESDINVVIGSFLMQLFFQLVPYYCVRRGTEMVVEGELANTRFPDLVVISEAGAKALKGKKRSLITLDMPAPLLAVEIVSSSNTDKASRDRDYIRKRQEYAQRNIPEYWIIDPIEEKIIVCTLHKKAYSQKQFEGTQRIVSQQFPNLDIYADQILEAGL